MKPSIYNTGGYKNMQNTRILEMINNEQTEELKKLIQEEIYQDSMKGNGDAKKRYAAMKRYFKYASVNNTKTSMPCKDIVLDDGMYNCFLDGYSFALSIENIGEIAAYDNSNNSYFDLKKLINYPPDMEKINVNSVLAEAKSKGYKYKKSEIGEENSFQYLFYYKERFYKVGILDQAFSIINDGEESEVYCSRETPILYMKTSIGMCAILPVNISENNKVERTIIRINA